MAGKVKPSEALPILLDAPKSATVDELAQHLVAQCGGVAAFAKEYIKEMRGQKGVAKARMLDGIMRIVTSSSTLNKKLASDEHGLSDEELAEEARRLLGKADGPQA